MDLFWILFLVLLTFLFVLVILPNIMVAHPVSGEVSTTSPAMETKKTVEDDKRKWEKEEAAISRSMLDQQFQPAPDTIPVNYPRKPIGACPYAKAPSTALRMADTPMCVSVQEHDMRMSSLGGCANAKSM